MHIPTFLSRCTAFLSFILSIDVQVAALSNHDPTNFGDNVTDIYQFQSNGSFIDNIAFRPDGTLLATRIDVPEIWSVDPRTGAGSLVYRFSRDSPNITSCFGITEIDHDVFAVIAGEFDVNKFVATPGSFSVWKLDFTVQHNDHCDTFFDWETKRNEGEKQKTSPTVSKLIDIPEAKALGASTLLKSRDSRFLLISDSSEGMIWGLDLETGEYNPTLSDGSMLPAQNGPAMGVNGIQAHDGYLYYASVTKREFRRVQIDDTASAIGPYELILDDIALDNFDLAIDGTVYFATNTENMIVKLTAQGEIVQVAGGKNSTALAGPTCCRLHPSGNILVVGTNGGITAPVNNGFKEPGKLATIRI